MITDNPNEEIKRQVADFERRTGRVPTIEELAAILEVDPRLLARRLKKSLITLGMDAQSEGTSAFKASLSELLSSGLIDRGVPGQKDLQALLQKARENKANYATLRWTMGDGEVSLSVQVYSQKKNHFGPFAISAEKKWKHWTRFAPITWTWWHECMKIWSLLTRTKQSLTM